MLRIQAAQLILLGPLAAHRIASQLIGNAFNPPELQCAGLLKVVITKPCVGLELGTLAVAAKSGGCVPQSLSRCLCRFDALKSCSEKVYSGAAARPQRQFSSSGSV